MKCRSPQSIVALVLVSVVLGSCSIYYPSNGDSPLATLYRGQLKWDVPSGAFQNVFNTTLAQPLDNEQLASLQLDCNVTPPAGRKAPRKWSVRVNYTYNENRLLNLVAKGKIKNGVCVQTQEPEIPTFWLPAGTKVAVDVKFRGNRPAVQDTTFEVLYGIRIRAGF